MSGRNTARTLVNFNDDIVEDKIKIFFRLMRTIPLDVKKSDTVQNIRKMFSELYGISMVNLNSLFFAGNWLAIDQQKVGDYDITDGSILNVIIDSGYRIQIHVKMSQVKKTITFDVDMRDTILSVKEMIQNKEGVTVSNQDLIYLGEELHDGHTVGSSNITAGSTIYALVHQGNGMMLTVINDKDRSVIALKVKGWYTVENVKSMIESMVGILSERQKLCVGRVKLENDKTLNDLNVLSGQTLNVLSGMLLLVETMTGKVHRFLVEEYYTIADVKELIVEKEGIRRDKQVIFFDGRRLEDRWTLADYKIEDGNKFYLMLALRGC